MEIRIVSVANPVLRMLLISNFDLVCCEKLRRFNIHSSITCAEISLRLFATDNAANMRSNDITGEINVSSNFIFYR